MGKTEDEICRTLGQPKVIAKEIKANFHINIAKNNTSMKNMFRAIIATVSLGFFNLIFILGPFLGLVGVLIGLYGIVIGLLVAPIGIFIDYGVPGNMIEFLFMLFSSMVFLSLGVLFGIGITYLSKWCYKLFVRYLQFNLGIIRGKSV